AGVGKAMSDGPMSPTMKRDQKLRYFSNSGRSVPNSSVRVSRRDWMDSGLKLDWPETRPMIVSTGLIGDICVMKKAADIPAKTTAASWTSRFSTKIRYSRINCDPAALMVDDTEP